PWFYYLLLLPQYEFVAVLVFPLASVAIVWRLFNAWRYRIPLSPRTFARGFLLVWTLGMLAILSWAGEKMPWNVIHVSLPMTLLAGAFAGDAFAYLERRWRSCDHRVRIDTLLVGGAALALLTTAFLSFAWASNGPYQLVDNSYVHGLRNGVADHWWVYVYLPWVMIIAVVALGVVRIGARRALSVTLLAGVVAFSLAQVHAEWRLTYREGDVPRDMLVYVQTTPDVPRVTSQLQTLSQQVTGGMGLTVWYDDVTQWPFNWYLKDFPNRRYVGRELPSTLDAQVIIISDDVLTQQMETELNTNYTYQEYPMRWWFPEENTYRRFAYAPDIKQESRQNYQDSKKPPFTLLDVAGSVWSSIWSMRHPNEQAKIFRMVAYREVPSGFGAVKIRVYVRNDLMPYFNQIRY
ncbi:MAG: TIGR03663 family protein, partial [Nitrolancea sp.]